MPTDFHHDLIFLIRSLVPRYDDLSAGEALQLVYLKKKKRRLEKLQITPLFLAFTSEYQVIVNRSRLE